MTINIDKPDRWKIDIAQSVDMYNEWFLRFAPKAFRETRIKTTKEVEETLKATSNLTVLSASLLTSHPEILPTLRMCACPPLAVDRLIGLSGVPKNLVLSLEGNKRIPPQMSRNTLTTHLKRLMETLSRLADPDIFPWLSDNRKPLDDEVARAATIVADRLCGAYANPIVRNAQEARQLASIEKWLKARGYIRGKVTTGGDYRSLRAGSYALRMNVNVSLRSGSKRVNIPVDVLIMPKTARKGSLPILIEAKSAGDFTNVNKRRKEEATKMNLLKNSLGKGVTFVLFLCGYFDSGYLDYEASEGIDWIWEHRMDDLELLGL